jgi:CO/xanthine dehydrogenase Mo-binding subunit
MQQQGIQDLERYERIDGREKVTGQARYAADISRPGLLHGRILRSPLPHARIRHIDARAARALPGVQAVLTAADLPAYLLGRAMRDLPILAHQRVRFIGEKVAAVAAESPELAEEALGLITVEYEELPAVFDPLAAMSEGAPLVHEPAWVAAHKTPRQQVAAYPNSVSAPSWGASRDEVQAALARCAHVYTHTVRTPIQHQGYLEPHACLVEFDHRGIAHIWAANKAPFLLLDYLREGMGLTKNDVELHLLPLGGDFGGKGSFMDIPIAYHLAKATGRPVRLVMTFTEELMAANPRHSAVITVTSGFDERGKLQARHTISVYNSGAYAAFKPAVDASLPGIRGGGLGPYEVPIWRVEGHVVYTNTVPCGHMRAPGEAQPIHAVERHMDLCARAMGMDPLELRLINAPTHPRETRSGEPGTPPRAREALRAAAEAIGWNTPKPPGVGRGLGLVEVGNSLGEYTSWMTVGRDGEVVLHTPIIENGAGMLTVFRQMVAEQFGLPPDNVRIEQTTEGIDYDRGVGGSRITRITGRMIELMSAKLREQMRDLLAAEWGFDHERVIPEPGGFRTPDGRFHTVEQAASLSPTDLSELLRYKPDEHDIVDVFTAIAVEVSVDAETGQVDLRRIVGAHEVGRVLNPTMHQGQLDGGIIQGMGYALMENVAVEDGQVTVANLNDYKLPTARDVPPMTTILLEPDLSLGITPVGEGPNAAISAAIANAVADATGTDQLVLPITPEGVREGYAST